MGILKEKSNKSLQSATLLLMSGQYCNSVQCSYFSALQLAKDKLNENLPKSHIFFKELKENPSSKFTTFLKPCCIR